MAWHRNGTASFTANNASVTGNGTGWLGVVEPGDALLGPDGNWYEVAAVGSATALTLATPYLGASAANAAYAIMQTYSRSVTLASAASNLIQTAQGDMNDFAQTQAGYTGQVDQMRSDVDSFLAAASPEPRIVQDITIGGSSDYFYPVFWPFPRNSSGISKITFCRDYNDNSGLSPQLPGSPTPNHVAALLLHLEGCSTPWAGNANYMKICKYSARYNPTASHARFMG